MRLITLVATILLIGCSRPELDRSRKAYFEIGFDSAYAIFQSRVADASGRWGTEGDAEAWGSRVSRELQAKFDRMTDSLGLQLYRDSKRADAAVLFHAFMSGYKSFENLESDWRLSHAGDSNREWEVAFSGFRGDLMADRRRCSQAGAEAYISVHGRNSRSYKEELRQIEDHFSGRY